MDIAGLECLMNLAICPVILANEIVFQHDISNYNPFHGQRFLLILILGNTKGQFFYRG